MSDASALSTAVKPLLAALTVDERIRCEVLRSVLRVLVAQVEQLAAAQRTLHARLLACERAAEARGSDADSAEMTQPPPDFVPNDPVAGRTAHDVAHAAAAADVQPRSRAGESPRGTALPLGSRLERRGLRSPMEESPRGAASSSRSRLKRRKLRASQRPPRTPASSDEQQPTSSEKRPDTPCSLRPQHLRFQPTPDRTAAPPAAAEAEPIAQLAQHLSRNRSPPDAPTAALSGYRTPAAAVRAAELILSEQRQRDTPRVQRVMRGRERSAFRAVACVECDAFFKSEAAAHDDPQRAYEQLRQSACRHRSQYDRPATPPDYWQLTCEETQTQPP